MDTFMVPTIQDKNASHPAFMWNYGQCNLFLHWDLFIFEHIGLWNYCVNKTCGQDNEVSSIWSQSLFYNCATVELH